MLSFRSRLSLALPIFAFLILLIVVSGNVLSERSQWINSSLPSGAPSELKAFWEAWEVISEEYVNKDQLNPSELSAGAINGLLDALGEPDSNYPIPDSAQLDAQDLSSVWHIWNLVVEKHGGVENLDVPMLNAAAIQGMLSALGNRFTYHSTKDAFEITKDDFDSEFEGIGARVQMINGQVSISSFVPDSPAKEFGVMVGDVILAVNGEPIQGLGLDQVVLKVRGEKGTPVALLVQHAESKELETVTVVRGLIHLESVYWETLPEDVAYLRIEEFVADTGLEVHKALLAIQDRNMKGIVLDLRLNPGGLLESTVDVASEFLPEGLVLYQIDSSGKRVDSMVRTSTVPSDLPMVVIVNAASASGAEVLAGALRDHGRASLVGARSFGKGSVSILRELSDGSAIYLTSALWYTPDGALIEGHGLMPDVPVPMDIRTPLGSSLDIQLLVARDILQQQLARETS